MLVRWVLPNTIAIVTASNDSLVTEANLLQSPSINARKVELLIERDHACAGRAYNAGLAKTDAAYVIFAHQDVYLSAGWLERLSCAIEQLALQDESWAVLGVWGVRSDGRMAGRVWCSGGNREHAAPIDGLAEVASIDEIVIVLNTRHGLRFDENLPGFHLYATDLILQARQRGLKAYVFDAPVVHNSRHNPNPFDAPFFQAYRYMQTKWAAALPILTCTVPVTRTGLPLYRAWLRREWRRLRRRTPARGRHPEPAALARQLGYEDSPPELITLT
jgi:hypothetical protein